MNRRISAQNKVVVLDRGDAFTLGPLSRGERIVCMRGTLWVTFEGDTADYIVRAGEERTAAARSKVIVSALRGPAELRVMRSEQRSPATGLRSARAALQE